MKRFLVLLCTIIVLSCGVAFGLDEKLQREAGSNTPIQGASWHGAKAAVLTVASTIVDFSKDLAYSVYSSADCYERWMPTSTSTKANYVKTPIVAGQWQTSVINSATPFGNFSGCTGGYLKKH